MTLLLIFAFLAGIATVLSPCILPVLPAILSASASGGKGRPFRGDSGADHQFCLLHAGFDIPRSSFWPVGEFFALFRDRGDRFFWPDTPPSLMAINLRC